MGLAPAAMLGLTLPLAVQRLIERNDAREAARAAAGDKAYKRKQRNIARGHYEMGCDEDG